MAFLWCQWKEGGSPLPPRHQNVFCCFLIYANKHFGRVLVVALLSLSKLFHFELDSHSIVPSTAATATATTTTTRTLTTTTARLVERQLVDSQTNPLSNYPYNVCFRGWEPWSSGYVRRLMFQRSKFESRHRILDWHISHLFVPKIVMCVWKDKNNWKTGQVGPFF